MNYYEHHIGDYAEATAHLSFVEDAAYSRCIRKYYAIEGPLPADTKAVQRLVGARSKDERSAVDAVLREFFTLQDDGWHNARCDEEIARYQDKRRKAKGSANARWSAKKPQCEGSTNAMRTHVETDANALPTQCEGNALQSPISNLQSEDSRRGEDPPVGTIATQIYRLAKQLSIAPGVITTEIKAHSETQVWQALGATLTAKPAEPLPYFRGCLKDRTNGAEQRRAVIP
jgi:uncharacterized protein YdaU (DUF1376 family)